MNEENKEEQQPGAVPDRNKLDELPDDIKFDLHFLIKQGLGGRAIKSKLESKWEGKTDLLPAAPNTYDSYKKIHEEEIERLKIMDDVRAKDAIQYFKEVSELFDVGSMEDVDSVKAHFDSLRKFCTSRIEFLQKEMARGFPDPRMEANLNSYLKDLMKLSEMYMKYREKIDTDIEKDMGNYLKHACYEILNGVIKNYKKIHGDNKLEEFANSLKSDLIPWLKDASGKYDSENNKK